MEGVLFGLSEFLQVHERNGLVSDVDVGQEVSHVTVSILVQVSQDTVLFLGVVLHVSVSTNLRVDSVSEDVLVSEEVLNLALIHGHSLLVSEVHGVLLESVSVLEVVVLLFRHSSELLLKILVNNQVEDLRVNFVASDLSSTVLVEQIVNEGTLLLRGQVSSNRQKLLERFLVLMKSF